MITPGDIDDREPLKNSFFIKALKGKLYADKGYISQKLTQVLFMDGLHLITSIRNNMKHTLMELKDKIMLRKRSVIETVNDELKNICQNRTFQTQVIHQLYCQPKLWSNCLFFLPEKTCI